MSETKFNLNLERLNAITVSAIILIIGIAFLPGTLFLFVFERSLFMGLDNFRLIILILSISVPIVLLNWFLARIMIPNLRKQTEQGMIGSAIVSSFFSIPVLYIPIVISYFFCLKTKYGVGIALAIEFIIVLFLIIDAIIHRKK